MRITSLAIIIFFVAGCAVQVPFEGGDEIASELMIETWSMPGEHWSYREDGHGEFNTYIGHPHFPFTYKYTWTIKDSVLYLEYGEDYEEKKKSYFYHILELREGRLVLVPIHGGRKLVLTVLNF